MSRPTTSPATDALTLAQTLAADFASRADEADRQSILPPEDIAALRASGYLALVIPAEFGGADLPMRDCLAAQIELATGSASTAIVAAMTLQTFGHARETHPWSPDIEAAFGRAVVTEGALFNAAASEPLMGSPSRGAFYASTAVQTPDGWQVNGLKTWITGGRHLTHLLVKLTVEKDSDSAPGTVLVPAGTPGLRWEDTWQGALSLRASDSHDLHLEDVLVPPENLVEYGEKKAAHPNAWFPMCVAATYLGAAMAARAAVIRYALERVPTSLGQPIATLPKIQRQIGEIDMGLQAARALLLDAAHDWDTRPMERARLYPRIAAAKHFAVETANNTTETALMIAGGQAITASLSLERHFRDVRAGNMQPPSGDTALEIIGKGAIEGMR